MLFALDHDYQWLRLNLEICDHGGITEDATNWRAAGLAALCEWAQVAYAIIAALCNVFKEIC